LHVVKELPYLFVFFQEGQEILPLLPGPHRLALHEGVCVFPGHAFGDQFEKNHLGVNDAMGHLDIGLHPLRIDHQFFYHPGKPAQHEIQKDRGVGSYHPFDGRMTDVPFVPQRHVFQRRQCIGAHESRQSRKVFR